MHIIVRLSKQTNVGGTEYWYIEDRNVPKVIHSSEQVAREEAERLAAKNPTEHFAVFSYIGKATCDISPVRWEK